MTTLLQRMHDELVRRNYAGATIRTYLHALRTCERYHRGRRLNQLGAQALRRYHAHLFREKKLAVGTVGTPRRRSALLLCAGAQATWACPRCGAAMIVGPILSALQLATLTWSFDTS